MKVFKGYMHIVKRNTGVLLMYISIFLGVTMGIQRAAVSEIPTDFNEIKIPTAVFDRENSILGNTIKNYIEREQELVEIKDDEQVIQEELYYRNIQYVIRIPENAQELFEKGEKVLQTTKLPGSATAYFLDANLEMLLNQIRACQAGGLSFEDACDQALSLTEIEGDVTLLDINGNNGQREGYNYFFAYLPYGFLGGLIMCISLVVMEFKKKEIRRRMACSCVPLWQQNAAAVACFLIVGMFTWTVVMLIQAGIYHGGIFRSQHRIYYIANSLLSMLTALSLAYFAGTLANSTMAVNGINNVLSLGLCFLGGIFVPLEMFGSGIEKVARFLPTWWYSTINGILGDYGTLSKELQSTVRTGLLIQLLFAAAVFGITMAYSRMRRQEKD